MIMIDPKKRSTLVPQGPSLVPEGIFFSDRARRFERCVAPMLCKNFRAEKIAEKHLQNNSSDGEARIPEKKIF